MPVCKWLKLLIRDTRYGLFPSMHSWILIPRVSEPPRSISGPSFQQVVCMFIVIISFVQAHDTLRPR